MDKTMFFSSTRSLSSSDSSKARRSNLGITRILRYGLIVFTILLTLGKPLMLPIGLTISPSSNAQVGRLDLLLITPFDFSGSNRGDLVLACRSGWWNTACLLGVYDDGNNGVASISLLGNGDSRRGVIFLNGDLGLFKVVARIPGVIWIPLFALYCIYLVLEVKKALGRYRVLGENYSLAALAIVLVAVNTFIVGATYVDQVSVVYALPGVSVRDEFFLDNSTLLVKLETGDRYILRGAECRILVNGVNGASLNVGKNNNGDDNGLNSRGYILRTRPVDQGTILVEIPLEIYDRLFNETRLDELPIMPAVVMREALIPIYCKFFFDKFEYVFYTRARFSWRDLDIYFEDHRLLIVDNRNPVSISINLTIFDLDREVVVHRDSYVIPKLGSIELNMLELSLRRARVIVEYEFLGLHRVRVGYYERET